MPDPMAITAGVTIALLLGLTLTRIGPDALFLGGLGVLLLTGATSAKAALAGFANEGLITIALLFVVAEGVRQTGATDGMIRGVLGSGRSLILTRLRLSGPVALASAFLNNTPVVAIGIPAVRDWARQRGIAPSQLLMPLSHAAILGGMCTLIGTSTNLIVHGMLIDKGEAGVGMFELAWVGVPAAMAGVLLVSTLGRWLYPTRAPSADLLSADPREYVVEMQVEPDGGLVGKSIEAAGLRSLAGLYLFEIERDGQLLPAVAATDTLRPNDRLRFTGVVESVVDLQRIPGLRLAADATFRLETPAHKRLLVEAVVSDRFPLLGRTVRASRFRSRYDAAILAVGRRGERLSQKIGDIELRPGDTLLLEAAPSWAERHRHSRDFYFARALDAPSPRQRDRGPVALAILAALIVLVASGATTVLVGAFLAAAAMLVTRCLDETAARRALDGRVLLTIAGALGVGAAITSSGLGGVVAERALALAGADPMLTLALVLLMTIAATELITNSAAVALVFPIAWAAAAQLGVSPMPFAIAIMIGGSASFLTPIGYQTNLMVLGPGGYRFWDYPRAGVPLTIVVAAITLLIVPRVWPF